MLAMPGPDIDDRVSPFSVRLHRSRFFDKGFTGCIYADSDDDGVPCLFALESLNETVRRDHYSLFVILIFGNFRLTAATIEACSGFPELLARASRA